MSEANHIQTQLAPAQMRAASFVPGTWNATARTVEVVFSTGSRVMRMDWWTGKRYEEELEISAEAVNLSRLNGGASVLDTHQDYELSNVIGVVERAWVEGAEARATLRLSERESVADIVQDIASGIIRNISVGYSIDRVIITPAESRADGGTVDLRTATRWTPAELSFVPVPADAGAGVRSLSPQFDPNDPQAQRQARMSACEFVSPVSTPRANSAQPTTELTMPDLSTPAAAAASAPAAPVAGQGDSQAAVAAERQRNADVTALCIRHNIDAARMNDFITSGATVDAVRAQILDGLAAASDSAGGQRNVNTSIRTVSDEADLMRRGIAAAIEHRVKPGSAIDDNARRFRGLSMIEMGREYLGKMGVDVRGMAPVEVAQHMFAYRSNSPGYHTTSDFGSILANVMAKRLRANYEEANVTFALWARRAQNLRDFKPVSIVQMSGAPNLLPLNEAGEITYGTMGNAAETYQAAEYARIVSFSRRMIINDDLSAFDRAVSLFGFSARRLENQLVYNHLINGTTLTLADGQPIFSAGVRNNNFTGAPSALSLTSLKTGRAAMRQQRGMTRGSGATAETGELLNLVPAYAIVPSALEQDIYQFTSANYQPNTPGTVNEFREGGRTSVVPVIEPLLDASSATAWYLAASNSQIDTVEYAYLEGEEVPQIFTKDGWEVEGLELKCRHTFASKCIDGRGLQRNAGV